MHKTVTYLIVSLLIAILFAAGCVYYIKYSLLGFDTPAPIQGERELSDEEKAEIVAEFAATQDIPTQEEIDASVNNAPPVQHEFTAEEKAKYIQDNS